MRDMVSIRVRVWSPGVLSPQKTRRQENTASTLTRAEVLGIVEDAIARLTR